MARRRKEGVATELADAGPRLAGRYAFRREIGRGASGRVLLAADGAAGGALRALKIVGAADAARLGWEFDVLARVAHPNVARVHELLRVAEPLPEPFRLQRGDTVLVEDFVEGERADRAASSSARAEERVASAVLVALGIARGLAAIHGVGLVHGDVKPENVVLSRTGEPVLVDLGLARPPGRSERVAGTPGYLAPEAWQGERSVATDLYALGATLLALLGARSPESESRTRSIAEHVADALAARARRSELGPEAPGALVRLVDSLLDADPTARPVSARDVAARLSAIAGDLGIAIATGGGADDAPTAIERATALGALALVGHRDAVEAIASAIEEGGRVIAVAGPSGAGRTRAIVEAVRRAQRARAVAERRVPTYVRADGSLPSGASAHDAIVHVECADAIDVARARALAQAALVAGGSSTIVLERDAPLEGADVDVAIGPLARDEIRELLGHVSALVGSGGARSGFEAELVDATIAASGGLAGRMIRIAASLVAAGRDPRRPGAWVELAVAGGRAVAIPQEARDVAELVAVAGGELSAEDVAAASRDVAGFDRLVAAGLATLTEAGRLHLRTDVARTLRRSLGDARRVELASALVEVPLGAAGNGFVRAALGDVSAAVRELLTAVSEARRLGDPERAASLASDAIDALPRATEAQIAPLRVARADALRARGRYVEASQAIADVGGPDAALLAAEVARLRGDRASARALALRVKSDDAATARARLFAAALLARLELDAGRLDEAEEAAAEACDGAAGAAEAHDASARANEVLALVALMRGRTEEGETYAARAIAAARRAGDRGAEARARGVAASVALAAGDVAGAARRNAEAVELAERAGELHAAATFLVNAGLTQIDAGAPGPAIAALRDGARRLAELGRDADVARALYNLGNAALLVGDDDLARSAAERARDAAVRAGDATARAYAEIALAEIAMRGGEIARARRTAETAWEAAAGAPERAKAAVAARRALLLASSGDLRGAAASIRAAEAAAREDGSDAAWSEHAVAAARVALAKGDADEAREHALEARARASRTRSWEPQLRAALAVADAHEASGQLAEAARALSEARSLLDAAARTLDPSGRARLRAIGAYQRALAAAPEERRDAAAPDRWRRLAAYAKRLTAERRTSRLREEIVDAALDLTGAERGFFVVRDDSSLRVRVARDQRGVPVVSSGDVEAEISRSIAFRALDEARPIATVDARTDARLDGAASVHTLALRSVVAVPIRRRGQLDAILYLDDRLRPAAFGADDVALLADLADIASIALEGAERLRAERRAVRRLEALRSELARTVETQAIEIATLRRTSPDAGGEIFPGIIARSEPMRRALELAARVAASDIGVLLTGESGTGKEIVARAIHDRSTRRDRAFVGENCGAIPEPLLESALFGHVRGAFTGADRPRVGLFEAADGGTLFLDEIGEMSPAMQAKLLRALQEREIRPVGSDRTRKVNVRIIAATHRDLTAMVEEGTFREDLYYRLAVVVVPLPPLRERPEDIPPLVAYLVAKHANGREIRVDKRALARLVAHPWPGNVRQLENEIQRALVLGEDVVREETLSESVRDVDRGVVPDELDLKGQLELLERKLIRRALERAGGNQTRASKLLGVSRYGLQKMLKRLGME